MTPAVTHNHHPRPTTTTRAPTNQRHPLSHTMTPAVTHSHHPRYRLIGGAG